MNGDPPPLEYQSPGQMREPLRLGFVFAGIALALAAGPGVSFLGLFVGELFESGDYAGLGGWMIGSLTAVALTITALISGLFRVHSPNGRRRGWGLGLLIGGGLNLLAVGVCFGLVT